MAENLIARGFGSIPTVLDVIENVLGDRPSEEQVAKLTATELKELQDRLSELWEAQRDQQAHGEAYLVGNWLHAFWSEPIMRSELSDSLLYYSNLLVLDPLADFFGDRSTLPEMHPIRYRRSDGQYNTASGGPRMWSSPGSFAAQASPADAAAHVARVIKNLYELEPLIRSGVLALRSQWPILRHRAHQMAASVRNDAKSPEMQRVARTPREADEALGVWDNLRGLQVRMDGPVHPADERWQTEPEFFYLVKTLAVADATRSQYVPSTEADLELLRAKMHTAFAHVHPSALLREISRVVVPSVDVPIQRAVELRQSSENFEDWRSSLDQLRRATTASSAEELRAEVEEELRPRVREIRRELARTSVAASARDTGADLVISGSVGLATALATHQDYLSVGTSAGAGVLTWLARAYAREKPGGADAVLAALVKKPPRSGGTVSSQP